MCRDVHSAVTLKLQNLDLVLLHILKKDDLDPELSDYLNLSEIFLRLSIIIVYKVDHEDI